VIPYLDVRAAYLELKAELDAAFSRVMQSAAISSARSSRPSSANWAEFCGARFCIGVGNGFDALRLLLEAWNVRGGEVIVPSNTYIATWLAVSKAGAIPIPVEPDASGNLDPVRVRQALGLETRAILAVHLYGRPADMTALQEIAAERRILLFEDCAQAHGAAHAGAPVGSLSNGAAFSFYPGKNLGGFGDGGAIVTNNDALADRARRLRNYGEQARYFCVEQGSNSRLDELQAAFLRVRLRRLKEWNARRARIASQYRGELAGILDLSLADVPAGDLHAWHVFAARSRQRDQLRARLEAAGVQTLIHYPTPPHLQPAYRRELQARGLSPADFPLADRLAAEEISLPIGPHLAERDVDRIIRAVREASV
jgi:dTDP-3-amino-3,4,6-trideoxy-alpha-D-glucose transaminase